MNINKKRKGFTLTELIVVIAIIAILSAILIPSITGYINNAKRSNALFEMNEMKKTYQRWIIEEDGNNEDIYQTCDSFVTYVGEMSPNYKNRVNYAVITGDTNIGNQSYTYVADGDSDGKVVFLLAATNGMYSTTAVTYSENKLGTTMGTVGVHQDIQEATNSVFGGEQQVESSTEKWEYAITDKVFSTEASRCLVTLYKDTKDDNNKIKELYIRKDKTLLQTSLAKYVDVNFYVFSAFEEGCFEENGMYLKSDIIWTKDGTAWDHQQAVGGNIDLVATKTVVSGYETVAVVKRVIDGVYNYYMSNRTTVFKSGGTQVYNFNDLVNAINFADKYVSQDTLISFYRPTSQSPYGKPEYKNVCYNDTIEIVSKEATISRNATLKEGCTLQLPCSEATFGFNYKEKQYTNEWYTYIEIDPTINNEFSKVIIIDGVSFDVYGEIVVSACTTASSKEVVHNAIYINGNGEYAVLENNGNVTIHQGGKLLSYGYVTGSGSIICESGSEIMDMLTIYNWTGYNNIISTIRPTQVVPSGGKAFLSTSPFNIYSISNIRCDVTINYGSEYSAWSAINSTKTSASLPSFSKEKKIIVGKDETALFQFNNEETAKVIKSYDNGYTSYSLYGNIKDNLFTIDVYKMTADTAYIPLYKTHIVVESGEYNICTNKYMVMPGSSLTVNSGATLNFSDTGGLAAMESMTMKDEVASKLPQTPGKVEISGTLTGTGVVTGKIIINEGGVIDNTNLVTTAQVKYGMGLIASEGDIKSEDMTLEIQTEE